MVDREKVIRGLTCCDKFDCNSCPYYEEEGQPCGVYNDALEFMKEQEPIEAKTMGESKFHGAWWFACGACGHAIDPEDNFCRECGRKVKWDE